MAKSLQRHSATQDALPVGLVKRRRPSQLVDRALDAMPDCQTLTFISAGTALPFALAPLLSSPKDKSKQERGRDDNQRQNGAYRRAAAHRSMIGQGW